MVALQYVYSARGSGKGFTFSTYTPTIQPRLQLSCRIREGSGPWRSGDASETHAKNSSRWIPTSVENERCSRPDREMKVRQKSTVVGCEYAAHGLGCPSGVPEDLAGVVRCVCTFPVLRRFGVDFTCLGAGEWL